MKIKLDFSKKDINLNEQLLKYNYQLPNNYEKSMLIKINTLKRLDKKKLIMKDELNERLKIIMDDIMINLKELEQ